MCVFPRAWGQYLVFAKLYEGLRLMSDLLWPTAAAADCSGLHVPAHPCSLHVYICVCVLHTGDRWPIACERTGKNYPCEFIWTPPITSVSICLVACLSEHRDSKGINADKMLNKNLKKPKWKLFWYCTSYTLYHSDRAEGSWIINEVQANRLPAVQPP